VPKFSLAAVFTSLVAPQSDELHRRLFVAGARAASAVRRRMFRAMRVVSFAPTSASGLTNEAFAAISPRQGVVGSIGATR
jgi:hypothetical protein